MEDFASAFDVRPVASKNALEETVTLAQELVDLENEIADIGQFLKAKSGRANELKTKLIPDKLAEIGMSDFTLENGAKVKVEDFVSGSLPKDPMRKTAALRELEEINASDVIKNTITLDFERSQHNEALALASELRDKGFEAEVVSSVHPQTYLALIRERLRKGEEVDLDKMGVFSGRTTKVILPKVKK